MSDVCPCGGAQRIAELERELRRAQVELSVWREWMHEDGFCRAVEMQREIERRLQAAQQ